MNQKFGCYNQRNEKTRCSVEKTNPRLFSNIGEMPEIPGHQIVNFMIGSQRNVNGIRHKFSLKNSAGDIALGKDRDLFRQFDLLKRFDQLQISGPMRFANAFNLALD